MEQMLMIMTVAVALLFSLGLATLFEELFFDGVFWWLSASRGVSQSNGDGQKRAEGGL